MQYFLYFCFHHFLTYVYIKLNYLLERFKSGYV